MAHDRLVGGMRCFEVLAVLSDYLDDELDAPGRARVEAHLAGCDWCARFGGEVGTTVAQLRDTPGSPPSVDDDVKRRLDERLRRELGEV